MFSTASVCLFVCLFVCQHDNFRTSKHRMTILGEVGVLYKKISTEFEFEDHSPPGRAPPKMWRWATTLGKSAQTVQLQIHNPVLRLPYTNKYDLTYVGHI